jgi:hypothetical protein
MKNAQRKKLDQAAHEIGATLGHLATRIDKWRQQRDEIVSEVRKAVEVGHKMLVELGAVGTTTIGKKGDPFGFLPKRKGGRKKGFKMSEEAKAKIADAARKRWALRKKGR